MKKKFFKGIAIYLLVILLLPLNSFAASKSIQVTLPKYPITINGMKVDNDCRQYPFIVYKGVTYLPLTYYDSRALGIETVLTDKTGLTLDKTGICCGYRNQSGKQKNRNSQVASLPSFLIKINGKVIANNQQPYPILMLRKIAYLPITTDVAKNQLGIDYQFSEKTGLQLKASGPQVKEIKLPMAMNCVDTGYLHENFMIAKGYLYYAGKKGEIYQLNMNKPTKAKKVHQLPLVDDLYGSWDTKKPRPYINPYYTYEQGEAVVNYQLGGASMGEACKIQLNADGSTTKKEDDKFTVGDYIGDLQIRMGIFEFYAGNMSIQAKGKAPMEILDQQYIYGVRWKHPKGGALHGGGQSDGTVYVYDNKVYVLACNMEDPKAVTSVHSVDLNTHKTVPVIEGEVLKFKMDDDKIYYYQQNQLYRYSVQDYKKQKINFKLLNTNLEFEALGGKIYYKDKKTGELYRYLENGKNEPLNPNAKLIGMRKDKDYLVTIFKEERLAKYRLMIFDKSGKAIFKSADTPKLGEIVIEKNQLVYMNKDGSVYGAILK
ncbi:MAG: hypothetical protein AB9856_05625 [Cellulosilyticaceae bacterium]